MKSVEKVRFKKKIVYKCLFLMCLILTEKNKENTDIKIQKSAVGLFFLICIC